MAARAWNSSARSSPPSPAPEAYGEFGPAGPAAARGERPNHHQIGRLLILCLREGPIRRRRPTCWINNREPSGPSAMPLARTVSSGRPSRRACNAVLVTGRGSGTISVRWGRAATAVVSPWRRVATSAEIKQGRTQGSVEIIDDGHVGCLVATAARTASRSVGDELALGDDHEIRRLELPQQKRRVRSSASRSRKFVASTRTTTPSRRNPSLSAQGMTCVGSATPLSSITT